VLLTLVAIAVPVTLALSSPGPGVIDRPSAPVPTGATSGAFRASLGGGELRLGPQASGLFDAELRDPSHPSVDVSNTGPVARVDLRAPKLHGLLARNQGSDWQVGLSTGLPWQVDVNSGPITADLDLAALDVRGVTVDAGISRLVVRLGAPAARVGVDLRVSTGLVDIFLPRSAALQIRVDGVAINNFGVSGLHNQNGDWQTPDLSGGNRYVIEVHATGARVRLHRL
jgi:hypothetical protein